MCVCASIHGYLIHQSYCTVNCLFLLCYLCCLLYVGVSEKWRCHGIGSHLIRLLQEHVSCHPDCKAVYLHVEATNAVAVSFYSRRGFELFCRVPDYYTIHHTPADGLLYVSYVNGGVAYNGSFSSWCQRYVVDSFIGRCLSGVVSGPLNSISSFWSKKK